MIASLKIDSSELQSPRLPSEVTTISAERPTKVAVVGYGTEGQAAVEYWRCRGDVTVCAPYLDVAPPQGVAFRIGPDYLQGIAEFDLIVRSPGVRPELLPDSVQTTSVIREFLDRCPAPVIGVTGTQGKGTTVTAIGEILKAAGYRVAVGGNIGKPPLAFLDEIRPEDWAVLELSNMQLMDARRSPHVAVVLPVTPDHLNWHPDVMEYYASKEPIAAFQSPDDTVVYATQNAVASHIAKLSPGRRIGVGSSDGFHIGDEGICLSDRVIVPRSCVRLRGRHNLENLTAAVAATYDILAADTDLIAEGISNVTPLPHRLAPVGKVDGVLYVNDSLSTTPETSRAAIAAFSEPKVVILGGSSKGVSYDALAADLSAAAVRDVLLIGAEALNIAAALDRADFAGYEVLNDGMAGVVQRAAAVARPGDVVLLSPACASFDAFRNYADRGNQFAEQVARLKTLPPRL